MTILFDIPYVNKEYGGIYHYSIGVLKTLANSGHNVLVNHVLKEEPFISLIEEYSSLKLLEPEFQYRIDAINDIFQNFKFKEFLQAGDFIYQMELCLKNLKVDVIHTPFQKLFVSAYVPSIVTMHDIQELHIPQYFTSKERMERANAYKNFIENADSVIVSFEHVKEDLCRFFDIEEDSVSVILANNNLWVEDLEDYDTIDVKKKFNITSDFLLFPANTWEHKNHIKLIEGLEITVDDGINIQLICTGRKEQYYEKIISALSNSKIKNHVKFLGVVTQSELMSLYQNCTAVIIPSIYEAGSFPLMESLYLGIPVICSNVTSLPVTIDNVEFVFNPNDPIDIARLIKKIILDENFRECSKENAFNFKNRYSSNKLNVVNQFNTLYAHLNKKLSLTEKVGFSKDSCIDKFLGKSAPLVYSSRSIFNKVRMYR